MANKKKVKKTGVIPRISKEVKDFMTDEEGKIKKKDIVRLGVSLAALGMMIQPEAGADASCGDVVTDVHSNALVKDDKCYQHANTHANHCSHNSHSQGGWC
ncbi:MAG: hypothetical protein HQL20_01810 [Candidatus Omnitrophica bacterium]|nr:hypothetical protein [Candidatus Omnitrophota bacterium]